MMIGTRGIIHYTHFTIPVSYYEEKVVLNQTNEFACLRMLYFEAGIGDILINRKRVAVVPHTLFCLNEMDFIDEVHVVGERIHLICFLPSAINDRLSLDTIRIIENQTISDSQDKSMFFPFIFKEVDALDGITLTTNECYRLGEILTKLKENLFVQSDSWPCLTRSYLIELLFFIERIKSFGNRNVFSENLTGFSEEGKISLSLERQPKFSTVDVIQYIHMNYMNKITIGNLSKQFNTNRTTLSKEFKAALNESVINYLIKVRIQIASQMLRDTALSIAVIIERVGFTNITHFNTLFKKYTNCLPKEYRKKYRSE